MTDPSHRRTYMDVMAPINYRDPSTFEPKSGWIRFKSLFVQLTPERATANFVMGSRESTVTHTIRTAYFEGLGIRDEYRFVLGSRVFMILGIMPDDEFHMEWMAKAQETDEVME